MCCMYTVYSGLQEWVIQITSIPINSCFCSFSIPISRIKFLVLVYIDVFACHCRKVPEEEMAKK